MNPAIFSSFSADASTAFPVNGLLPKDEIEASTFLQMYPNYDGRGVVVAVLDTGVDPAAAGLQLTTDGQPKILDLVDCSGSGDVVMTITPINEGPPRTVMGLSGRQLTLSSTWENPTGIWRLGLKRAYDLFPEPLVARLKKERWEAFQATHTTLCASVQQQLNAFQAAYPDKHGLSKEVIDVKLDLQAQAEALKDMFANYQDPGPVYDCLVWHDGRDWRAVIDTMEQGCLEGKRPLCDYRLERQYESFGHQDLLSYSVKIYDEGATLSIVTMAGSHGTHVASIIGAHHVDDPVLNGVAPGVQIVSLKIGDTRLGSMETHQALMRAAIAMVANRVDIANMSYGESAGINNVGLFIDFLRKTVIQKQGILFVSSAGNSGPALSTVGTPGGTTSGVISVGAYVTTSMIKAEYSISGNVSEGEYTWSSRGPT